MVGLEETKIFPSFTSRRRPWRILLIWVEDITLRESRRGRQGERHRRHGAWGRRL